MRGVGTREMYRVEKCRLLINYDRHRTHWHLSPIWRHRVDCHRNDLSPIWFVTDLTGTRAINALARFSGGTDMFYHLHRIRAVRRQLGCNVTARLVTAIVLSRLDYCNAVLAGLPASTLAPFQRVLHAAARTVMDLKPRDRVTPALRELHWLPAVLAGSQVASGTHAGIYLRPSDIGCQYSRSIYTACFIVWQLGRGADMSTN